MQTHREINYGGIKTNLEDSKKNTSDQLAGAMTYDVDFTSKAFGHIRMKNLLVDIPVNHIKSFFQEFHQAPVIVITVKDIENPMIDENNEIILEFKKHERRLPSRFFRALLSKEIKDEYKKKYPDTCENNRFKRLRDLLCDRKNKVYVEEF